MNLPKRPRDPNQRAKLTVDLATGQATDEAPEPTGRQLSGLARAAQLTPEERRELGRKGAAARWSKTATNGQESS